MRITHAQPLMPSRQGGQLEPKPLLSQAEAEAEASALYAEGAEGFTQDAIADVPAECFSHTTQAMLASGELAIYTHLACPYGRSDAGDAADRCCRDYLVRIEEE